MKTKQYTFITSLLTGFVQAPRHTLYNDQSTFPQAFA
jgi:hypothetical protein